MTFYRLALLLLIMAEACYLAAIGSAVLKKRTDGYQQEEIMRARR
jgi:hypothetical protein